MLSGKCLPLKLAKVWQVRLDQFLNARKLRE